jgi:hypothetical protein
MSDDRSYICVECRELTAPNGAHGSRLCPNCWAKSVDPEPPGEKVSKWSEYAASPEGQEEYRVQPEPQVTVPEDLQPKPIHTMRLYSSLNDHTGREEPMYVASTIDPYIDTLRERLGAAEQRAQELNREVQNVLNNYVRVCGERDRLKEQLAAMTEDRDLWKDEHNEDCPNAAKVAELEGQLEDGRRIAAELKIMIKGEK